MNKKRRYEASITIFLSMSLSVFIMLITMLIGLSITNYEKERFEIADDIAMRSVFGEYGKALFEEYDLLFVDMSYLCKEPSIDNVKNRIDFYLRENTEKVLSERLSPWGRIAIESVIINGYRTATTDGGEPMRSQASLYVTDSPSKSPYVAEAAEALPYAGLFGMGVESDPFGEWESIMAAIDGMEKPKVIDEYGKERVVEVCNPSDWVYSLSGSDVFYSSGISLDRVSNAKVDIHSLISNRGNTDTGMYSVGMENRGSYSSDERFCAYLLDKMGCYKKEKEERVLSLELEYMIGGQESDAENLRDVTDRIFIIRFADNLRLALGDGGLNAEAYAAAAMLEICTLSPEFTEPVAKSILFGCAYLETLSDIRSLYDGERVPVIKSSHSMRVSDVLGGIRYVRPPGEGITYRQFLIAFIGSMNKEEQNMRSMDIMELNIRKKTGNHSFGMDKCLERINTSTSAKGSGLGKYVLERTYGYF